MTRTTAPGEWLVLFTAVGLCATFAAPWLELQGTFQSWRILEWHTFWRGDTAFQLGEVIAPGYAVPVEYATSEMETLVRTVTVLASVLGVWHGIFALGLVVAGAKMRSRSGAGNGRIALEIAALVVANVALLYLLAGLLALPSTLALKVDFRTPTDIHTDSLVWSSVSILPIAPVLSCIAAAVEILAFQASRGKRSSE